jgi:hypothetical protein
MKRVLFVAAFVAVGMVAVVAAPGAVLAGSDQANENGACHQTAHDVAISTSTEGTVGDAVSDVLYGNEPWVAPGGQGPSEVEPGAQAGNVSPTLGPGPWTKDGGSGATMGDVQALIRASCG